MKLMNETQRQAPFVAEDSAEQVFADREAATAVDAQVRGRLADCRFAFFVNQVTWHFDDGVLTLEGRVRTEHLKCALASLLRDIQHVEQIIDRVDVVSSTGVSRIQPK
ncbi:MAG: hypothetical protein DWQ31_17540 [Planctomycetota bacterium]|mgnify:CR=1 FL=1|nr:MAG: hypothetical protein DWQ31_17540 [Planctomycetota bacterium]REJ92154.1 MAG: hypothetical protein DWQ35_13490 [Planctomycetota bacterium]REK28690.1 MAG: hypothetical protein DWQ42_05080 [Planctomycetota bacterium]REK39304.1 MAG: hypothetical protein DWQ46_18660 [Planctomycetota bacterium]